MVGISNLVVLLDFLSAKSYQNFNYILDIHKTGESWFLLLVDGHQTDLLRLALYVLVALKSKR